MELNFEDSYGPAFAEFHKKYKGRKFKSDGDYYVQFTSFASNDKLDKAAYDSPDHSDPVGVYGYPLKYVIDHPSDIWYGRSAAKLRVLKRNANKSSILHLQDMDEYEMKEVVRKSGSYPNEDIGWMMKEIRKNKGYKGPKAMHKAFMTMMQMNVKYDEDGDLEYGDVRSGKEQTDMFMKAGYNTIVDNARNHNTAIINDREPNQVIFLHRSTFDVIENFDLGKTTDSGGLVIKKTENDDNLQKKIAALTFQAIGDKVKSGKFSDGGFDEEYTFWSHTGRAVSIKFRKDDSWRDDPKIKIGQKPHKLYKKFDGYSISVWLKTEYGKFLAVVGKDDGTIEQAIAELKTQFEDAKEAGVTDPEYKPSDNATHSAEVEAEKKRASDEYYAQQRAKELAEHVGAFNTNYEHVVAAANVAGVDVPSTDYFDTDEKKASASKLIEKLGKITRNNPDKFDGLFSKAPTADGEPDIHYRIRLGISGGFEISEAKKIFELQKIINDHFADRPWTGYYGYERYVKEKAEKAA